MSNILRSFSSLYFATLLMVLASGVLTTYLGLRLAADSAAQIWIGGMMSAYYLGLVAGSKIGHRLIARVGHIRAFVASAGITTASALGHALIDDLAVWLVLRLMVGMGMMCMYMVLESWLNEQADSKNRGTVFASYMIVSYLGLVLGQLAISLNPELTLKPLLIVAMCFALCIVPLALTRRIHPAPLQPAPLKIKLFWQKVPQSLTTIAMAGVIVGSFYGLAPAFAASQGMNTEQVAAYMATTVMAGLLAPLSAGSRVFCTPGFNALRFFKWMDDAAPTWYTAVPMCCWPKPWAALAPICWLTTANFIASGKRSTPIICVALEAAK